MRNGSSVAARRLRCALLVALAPLSARAGVFTIVPMTGDADSGVLPTNTYTHVIDYNKAANNPAIVNGVKFNGDTDNPNGNWSLVGVNNGTGGGVNAVGGGMGSVVNDFRYGTDAGGNVVLTLRGLTPGIPYVSNFYNRGWDNPAVFPRLFEITASDGGFLPVTNQDAPGQGNGSRISYAFTPTTNTFSYTIHSTAADTFHHYGFSNQTAVPGAGPFVGKALLGDADSGISSTKTYTHAVDVGAGAPTVVNGVTFVGGMNSGDGGFGKNYTIIGATNLFTGDNTNVTGGIGGTLSTFLYGATNAGTSTLTLDGLTPGARYELSLFASGFGAQGGRFLTVSHDNGSIVVDANGAGDNNGVMLTYSYTATGSSQTFTFDPHDSDDTFHIYSFANAVAVPEPGMAAVLVIAAAGVCARRRRA